jgi:hypothetical protein
LNALPGDPLPDTWTFPCCPQPPDWRLDWERPNPVPESVILRLADKLEVPDPTEAHRVEWV